MFQSGDEFNDDLDLDTASASGSRREDLENSALNSTTQNVRRLMASAAEQQSTSNFIFDTEIDDADDEDLTAELERVESQTQLAGTNHCGIQEESMFKMPSTSPSLQRQSTSRNSSPDIVPATPMSPPPVRVAGGRRRFPGPAGVMMGKRSAPQDHDSVAVRRTDFSSKSKSPRTRESNAELFVRSNAWQKLLEDRGIDEEDPESLTNKFSTTWVRGRPCPPGSSWRTPFFVCLLKHIDPSTMDASCVFADRSGTITAQVHRDVMEKYGPFFQPGSAFVLKNVIVIATERNSYMIVTLNNLVKLYKASDGTASAEICRLTKEDIERSTRAVEEAEKRMRFAAKPPSQASGSSGPPRGQFSFNVTTFPGSMQPSRPQFTSTLQPLQPVQNTPRFSPQVDPNLGRSSATVPRQSVDNLFEGLDEESIFGDF